MCGAFDGLEQIIRTEIDSLFVRSAAEPNWSADNPIQDCVVNAQELFASHWPPEPSADRTRRSQIKSACSGQMVCVAAPRIAPTSRRSSLGLALIKSVSRSFET